MGSELHALVRAIDAVTWEWLAAWHFSQAVFRLGMELPESLGSDFAELQEMGHNLRRASSAWGVASNWLTPSDDRAKAAVYQLLCEHGMAQQQRLDQQLEQL